MSFTHLVLGTNDLERARSFYDATLAPLGMKRVGDEDHRSTWSAGGPALVVGKPIDGEAATKSNGLTVGLAAKDKSAVDAFHAAGIAAGGTCEGAPGGRLNDAIYAAYVRDADGNKLCAIAM